MQQSNILAADNLRDLSFAGLERSRCSKELTAGGNPAVSWRVGSSELVGASYIVFAGRPRRPSSIPKGYFTLGHDFELGHHLLQAIRLAAQLFGRCR